MESVFAKKCVALNGTLLRELDFFKRNSSVQPLNVHSNPAWVKKCSEQITDARKHHKQVYQTGYVDPLIENLQDIIDALIPYNNPVTGPEIAKYAYLCCLINAALQPAQDLVYSFLSPIQRITDELYSTFLAKRQELGITRKLDHQNSPLVGIVAPFKISKRAPMPSTFELEQMRSIDWLSHYAKDFTTGTIVVPAGYWDAPLLWGVLGHEVGGHYMLTACKGDHLLGELQHGIYEAVSKQFQKEVAILWLHWSEEASADVCGVLHLGPSFGIGAISYYTAQLFLGKWPYPKGQLLSTYEPANRHPTQILIPYLISGAVDSLKHLNSSRKLRYMAQLDEIANFYSKAQEFLEFKEGLTLTDVHGVKIRLPNKLPLQVMQESARIVGRFIATARLKALRGFEQHDLQDLVTWGNAEEDGALEIAEQIASNDSNIAILVNGKKATGIQLLGGGILAVIRNPELYAHANNMLIKELRDTSRSNQA